MPSPASSPFFRRRKSVIKTDSTAASSPIFSPVKIGSPSTPIFEKFSPRNSGSQSRQLSIPKPVVAIVRTPTKTATPSPSLRSINTDTDSEISSVHTTKISEFTGIIHTQNQEQNDNNEAMPSTTVASDSSPSARAQLEKERVGRQGGQVKAEAGTKLTPLKIYLLGYNLLSALLWLNLLIITTSFILRSPSTTKYTSTSSFFSKFLSSSSSYLPTPIEKIVDHLRGSYEYKNLGWYTKYTQTLAILEVVHAALGWVRSPTFTVAAQVASRVWTVWGVVEAVPQVTHNSPLFTTMLFAWSLTEVIRYTFYFFSLLSINLPILNYLRYTTFIPLYPLGAGSEAFLSFSTLPSLAPTFSGLLAKLPSKAREVVLKSTWGRQLLWNLAKKNVKNPVAISSTWGPMEFVRLGLFVFWWPALYVLFTYMLKQRTKVLGKGRGKSVGGQNKAL